MNFQHLRYFKAACQYHNISKAAEKANISQSSISAAIKSLEREYGVILIKRQRVGFVLTPEGQTFLSLIDSLIEHIDKIEGIMADASQKHKTIRFGIPPMICAIFLRTLFKEFGNIYPEIKISFDESGGYELLQELSEKTLDMALVPVNGDSTFEGYNSIHVARLEDVCCVSEDHPLARNKSVIISEVSKYPLIMFSDGFYHNTKMTALFEKANAKANIIYQASQLSTMEKFISENIAVGFLFKERAEQVSGIKWLSLDPKVYTSIALVWNKDVHMTKDMRRLIDFFSQESEKYLREKKM